MEEELLSCLKAILKKDTAPLHEPVFQGNEWQYVKECLDTGWVSSVGQYVNRFEEMLAEFTGVKKAVAVVNGTAALHTALLLTGVQAEDEVLLPALTFVATANAVSYCGAVPHFADSSYKTLGVCPEKLRDYLAEIGEMKSGQLYNRKTGRKIKALIVMHTFGHPVDLDPIVELCAGYNLKLIEDAAESLGSYYKGRHTGNFGLLSILSFNGNKVVTTGGGGAILTNDEELGKLAKHLTTTAKIPHKWLFNHDMRGYNYRLPNLNAALGCAQMEKLPEFLRQKRLLFTRYKEGLQNIAGISVFQEPEFAKSNYWLQTALLDDSAERDLILAKTNENGIMTRPCWTLMPELAIYKDCPKMDLSVAEDLTARIINLPSSANL
ncbi:MAG: LegC family aminotransferase [bacterium]